MKSYLQYSLCLRHGVATEAPAGHGHRRLAGALGRAFLAPPFLVVSRKCRPAILSSSVDDLSGRQAGRQGDCLLSAILLDVQEC